MAQSDSSAVVDGTRRSLNWFVCVLNARRRASRTMQAMVALAATVILVPVVHAEISLETAMRRLQARIVMLQGMGASVQLVDWPMNADSEDPGDFPDEAFYDRGPNQTLIDAARAEAAEEVRDVFLDIIDEFLNESSAEDVASGTIESLVNIDPQDTSLSPSETSIGMILGAVETWLPKMRYRVTELAIDDGSLSGRNVIRNPMFENWEGSSVVSVASHGGCGPAQVVAEANALADYSILSVAPYTTLPYECVTGHTFSQCGDFRYSAALREFILHGDVSTQGLSGSLGLWVQGIVMDPEIHCQPATQPVSAGASADFPLDGRYYLLQSLPAGLASVSVKVGRGEENGGFVNGPGIWRAEIHWLLLGDMFQFRDLAELSGSITLQAVATTELLGEASDSGLIEHSLINPRDCNPVSLATGTKTERMTDLTVQVTGPDFELFREYTSDIDYLAAAGGSLAGRGWGMNVFRRLAIDESGQTPVLKLDGVPVHQHLVFHETDPLDSVEEWSTGGPTPQRLVKGTIDIDGLTWRTWRLIEPGGWELDFVRELEVGDTGPQFPPVATVTKLEGLVLQERDVYGNYKTYEYYTTPSEPRLRAVYLNGSPKNPAVEAIVIFDWYLDDDQVQHFGLLDKVRVERWDATNETFVVTHKVDYTYASETDGNWSADIGEVAPSAPTGRKADLVQVVQQVRIDKVDEALPTPGNEFWTSVCQYRYHDGGGAGLHDDDRLTTRGAAPHQLKMVILPEQIEYYAQQKNSVGTPSVDSVETAAALLLTRGDGDDAFDQADFKVVDLAAKILSYYPPSDPHEGRVAAQYVQTDCGCGGAGDVTQGKKFEYTYYTYSNSPAPEKLTTRVRELLFGGAITGGDDYPDEHRRIYHDMERIGGADGSVPYLCNRAIVEPVITDQNHPAYPGGRTWVTHYEYDPATRNLIKEYTPEAMASYTPADAATTPGDFSYSFNSTGLVHAYAYTTDNRRSEVRLGQDNPNSPLDVDDFILIEHTEYGELDEVQRPVNERPWLPKFTERFRTEYTGAWSAISMDDEIERTEFEYGFHSDDNTSGDLAFVHTIVEAELEPENGPGGVYESYELFDIRGRNVWSRAPDLSLTYREFDEKTGTVTRLVRNADPDAPAGAMGALKLNAGLYFHGFEFDGPTDEDYSNQLLSVSGWGRSADGGQLATVYKRDLLGRIIEEIAPGGVSTYIVRELRTIEERPGIFYYAEVTLPHRLAGVFHSEPNAFNGPARIAWMNAGADVIGLSNFTINSGQTYAPTPAGDFTYTLATTTDTEGEIARSRTQHLLSGVVASSKVWHDVSGNGNYTTSFDYDLLGRVEHLTNANGTITGYVYDALDRVISKKVGTTTGNLVEVARYFYDHDTGPVQGVGNGNLTFTRLFTGDDTVQGLAVAERDTIRFFDFRNRPVYTRNPLSPHSAVLYDNLDRPIATAVYSTDRSLDVGFDPNTFDAASENQDRGRLTTAAYSQRGLQFASRTAIDASLSSPTYLEDHSWFDSRGREIASWGPNGPGIKRIYDAHSRVVTTSITDRGGDERPGTTGNHGEAVTLDDDIVLEQTHHTYNDEDRLVLSESRQRLHDASGTGALGNTTAVTTFVGHYYDDARRVIATVDYGTNITSDMTFRTGGTAPDVSGTPPDQDPVNPEELVTTFFYNKRGLVERIIDPEGRITKTLYDDLSRTGAVIENWDSLVMEWSGGQWEVTSRSTTAPDTHERATSFVYSGEGQTLLQIAHLYDEAQQAEASQTTEYVYSASNAADPSVRSGSLVYSRDLLTAIHYPDEVDGSPSTDDFNTVYLTYNALGELRTRIDQNQTRHDYTRDVLGRVTRDAADFSNTQWPIDTQVKGVTTTYDSLGRTDTVESLDASDNVLNSVEFAYTPLWQVAGVVQDVDGDGDLPGLTSSVSLDPATIGYTYSSAAVDTSGNSLGNYSRLSSMTHTDATTTCSYGYNSLNSLDDRISRMVKVQPSDELGTCEYEYVGVGGVVLVDYTDIDVQQDCTFKHNGARNTGPHNDLEVQGVYHGWDRFGRTTLHAWVDGGLTLNSPAPVPDRPPLFEQRISYDRVSNRLQNIDDRPGGSFIGTRDAEFSYDRLDRLLLATRGLWDDTAEELVPGHRSERWSLDVLGNWIKFEQDRGGDPEVFGETQDFSEDRLHNMANEIVEVDSASPLTIVYDDVGNIREQYLGGTAARVFIHDAWNRLVEVAIDPDTGTPSNEIPIAKYQYNGLGWRTLKLADTDPVPDGTIDQLRIMYYDAEWRLAEEHVINDLPTGGIPGVYHQVWGLRHIDDPIARRVGSASLLWPEEQDVSWIDSWYYLTDVQFSVVGLVNYAGDVVERVSYDSYGTGHQRRPGNLLADRVWDPDADRQRFDEAEENVIDEPLYASDLDLNRTGTLGTGSVFPDDDFQHFDFWLMNAGEREFIPDGWISEVEGAVVYSNAPPDNPIGFGGYVFNPETGLYTVRNRTYDPALGRWLQRDPKGYVDGMSMYQYVGSTPFVLLDPMGLGPYDIGPPTRPSIQHDNGFLDAFPHREPVLNDYVAYQYWLTKQRVATAVRPDLADATRAYGHFLEGEGRDYVLDYDAYLRQDAAGREFLSNELANAQRYAEQLYAERGSMTFQMTGAATPHTEYNKGAYPVTENWQKAIGGHTIWGSADVSVICDDKKTYFIMALTLHAEDRYNFNPGAADLATGIPDSANGRFELTGLAHQFTQYGEARRYAVWELGQIPETTQSGSSKPRKAVRLERQQKRSAPQQQTTDTWWGTYQ